MKIEVLYPEICNLYGDLGNIRYLQKSCPELEVVETDLKSRPAFLDGGVDLVYVGSATERGLQLLVEALTPYRDALADYVDAGNRMLATGNALDALGKYVDIDGKRAFDGLGSSRRTRSTTCSSATAASSSESFRTWTLWGFKSVFGHTYPDDELSEALFRVERGVGRRPGSAARGLPPRRADGNVSDRAAAGAEPAVYEVAPARAGREE